MRGRPPSAPVWPAAWAAARWWWRRSSPLPVVTRTGDAVLRTAVVDLPVQPHGATATRRRYTRAVAPAAVLAAVGCVVAWLNAASEVVVAPVLDGEPSTTSHVYYAPMLTLSLLLATVAGVLATLGIARLRRGLAKPSAP